MLSAASPDYYYYAYYNNHIRNIQLRQSSRVQSVKPSTAAKILLTHRESLGTPSAISMDSMVGEPSTSQHDNTPPALIESNESEYQGWMNEFCVEPASDTGTCCLGFWLPCVLFGKIDERLQRVQKGKDPKTVGNGCNGSCLIWLASGHGFCGEYSIRRSDLHRNVRSRGRIVLGWWHNTNANMIFNTQEVSLPTEEPVFVVCMESKEAS